MLSDIQSPSKKQRTFWLRAIWISAIGICIPPLFGLAGTIIGMVGAFNTLGESGQADPEELAGNISIALLSTAYGLVISTLFLVALIISAIRYRSLKKHSPS